MRFRPLTWAAIGFVKAWRLIISPLYGNVCRYHPSCSAYGLKALQVHGIGKGGWLTVSRIARCNPWSQGGYDPVPGTPEAALWEQEQAESRATGSTTSPLVGATPSHHRGDL